jgi:cell shape-determining protein MreC
MSFYQGFKNEYQDEKKKNETLKTQLLKNNDSYEMEKTIRNQLNLTKDNEVEVIIPDPTPSPVVVTPTPEPPALQWAHTFIKN